MGVVGAWLLQNFRTLHSAPTDFEVPITKGDSKVPIYEIGGTRNYKFLTQALL